MRILTHNEFQHITGGSAAPIIGAVIVGALGVINANISIPQLERGYQLISEKPYLTPESIVITQMPLWFWQGAMITKSICIGLSWGYGIGYGLNKVYNDWVH